MENNENMEKSGMALNPGAEGAEEMTETSPAARKKQKAILAAALIICTAIFATGTLAYFTAEETAYNVITIGTLSMKLVEETAGGKPWPEEGISGVAPGTTVDKIPYVVNNGGIEFYTRIRVDMKVTDRNGKELSGQYIDMNFDRTNWTEKDGWYYYNGVVAPGTATEPLFTEVTFDAKMNNAYMNAKIKMDVHAEAVQSRNNGDSALTASGWESE